MKQFLRRTAILLAIATLPSGALAEGVGRIKAIAGEVSVERGGKLLPAVLGAPVYASDQIATGKDGSVGLLFDDDSRLSLGPNSRISLDKFEFDFATHEGGFDVSMKKGTLSVISGKLVEKSPGSLKVRTPAAILAVRGTEFSVLVEDPGSETAKP